MSRYNLGDIVTMASGEKYVVKCKHEVPLDMCYLVKLEDESEKTELSKYSTMALLQELVERAMRDE